MSRTVDQCHLPPAPMSAIAKAMLALVDRATPDQEDLRMPGQGDQHMMVLADPAIPAPGDQCTPAREGQRMPRQEGPDLMVLGDHAIQAQEDQRTPVRGDRVTTDQEGRVTQDPEGDQPALRCVSSAGEPGGSGDSSTTDVTLLSP